VPVLVALLVLVAGVVSTAPGLGPTGPTGGPSGDGPEARLAIAGLIGGVDGAIGVSAERADAEPDGGRSAAAARPAMDVAAPGIDGPFLEDGTILKPVAVDTTIIDASDKIQSYKVAPGDTLTGIANRYGVSMMTIWWANDLASKDDLHVGQTLVIPPVDGLVVTVKDGDTLESVAAANHVATDEILAVNELEDPTLIVGQVLLMPGARGEAIPTPTPAPTRKPTAARSGSSGGSVSGPSTYGGGSFVWPVVGGGNYISQYYRSGHYGLDIAADYGSKVRAAAAGTVTFAGWKSNGGGYQVWISHGSGLYTTYNHLSGVSVGRGQQVSRGQQVGRIGQSGWATGPHLHFEVWRGPIWNGGSRTNPLGYL
jgi:murein DD-endopeptidase MepM/ murein hydrolase activator NlpD